MQIATFADLLSAARKQHEPQRLMFVFAAAGLPEGASAEQRAQFDAGDGGELTPLMCVDKAACDLAGFETLAAEASSVGPGWALVFTAALSGRGGRQPGSEAVQATLQRMVDSIKAGRLDGMLPFNRLGEPVRLS